ncbi:MAG: Helix-turn-helix domain of resolvase, partial [Segetibacter sp.]|nr:Helix-turn-helix domain of resolvase [Segetibacter sp.]
MIKNYPGESWKEVRFDFEFTNDYRLEVSNFGRLKSYNKLFD